MMEIIVAFDEKCNYVLQCIISGYRVMQVNAI